jgi:DNA-binding MarR family transcriptional regulator
VNGLELYLMGRRLMKLGVDAIPSSGFRELPASVRSVLVDALTHTGSSISEITGRTGFPQSHVSASVARLRELGALVTEVDPADRRRTLVQAGPGVMERASQRTSVPVDATIAAALGPHSEGDLAEVLAALDLLARRLAPGVLSMNDEEEGEG